MKRYAGAISDIDIRVEVGLVSSNIVISALDGYNVGIFACECVS